MAKIHPKESFDNIFEPNSEPSGATCYDEARRQRYQAVTQVKELNPEIILFSGRRQFSYTRKSTFLNASWQVFRNTTKSEITVGYKMQNMEIRETHTSLATGLICNIKLSNSKVTQKEIRESEIYGRWL